MYCSILGRGGRGTTDNIIYLLHHVLWYNSFEGDDKMELNKELNVIAFVIFILVFSIGASETGYTNMGDNLVSIFLMLFGVLGIITQFVLLNISLMIKK